MLQANRLAMKICILSFHHHSSNSIHTKLPYKEYMFEVCDISTGEAEEEAPTDTGLACQQEALRRDILNGL